MTLKTQRTTWSYASQLLNVFTSSCFNSKLHRESVETCLSSKPCSVSENLNFETKGLEEPDFNALARVHARSELCKFCRLILIIAVQCDQRMDYVEVIQRLEQSDQQQLMLSIETTRTGLEPIVSQDASSDAVARREREGSQASDERSISEAKPLPIGAGSQQTQLMIDYEARGATIESLESEVGKLQTKVDEMDAELQSARRSVSSQDQRIEITRISDELRKCEDALATAEAEVDRLQGSLREQSRAVSVTRFRPNRAS